MSLRDVQREFKELPLASLDAPQLDARLQRDPEKVEELARDIARRGIILPLAVVRVGERYEIIDGFTRFIAATRAQLATAPCMIYPSKDTALEGVKYAANLFRLDMTPAEEAIFFAELLKHECGDDFEKLCTLVGRGEAYVDSRLALLNGDEEIFTAVKADQIKLGVAHKLNEIRDESWRRHYLRHAVKEGATVAVVTGWVAQHKALYESDREAPPSTPAPAIGPGVASTYDPNRCYVCGESDQHVPELLSVHTHCRLAVLDKVMAAYHGGNG